MMKRPGVSVAGAIAAFPLLFVSVPSWGQQVLLCEDRPRLERELGDTYGERLTALGVTGAGAVMELWQSVAGRRWTIVITFPDGKACVVGAGTDWLRRPPPERKGVEG